MHQFVCTHLMMYTRIDTRIGYNMSQKKDTLHSYPYLNEILINLKKILLLTKSIKKNLQ